MLLRPPPTYRPKLHFTNPPEQNQTEIVMCPSNLLNEENQYGGFEAENKHGDQDNNAENLNQVAKDYAIGKEAIKNENCSTFFQSYRDILTNVAFLRQLIMMLLASFSAYSILYLTPPLAKEWGASEVTASLTVTAAGGTELISR